MNIEQQLSQYYQSEQLLKKSEAEHLRVLLRLHAETRENIDYNAGCEEKIG